MLMRSLPTVWLAVAARCHTPMRSKRHSVATTSAAHRRRRAGGQPGLGRRSVRHRQATHSSATEWIFDVAAAYDLWLKDQNRASIPEETEYDEHRQQSSLWLAATAGQRAESRVDRQERFAAELNGMVESTVK